MIVYITKYATTHGIIELEVEEFKNDAKMVVYKGRKYDNPNSSDGPWITWDTYFHNREWTKDREEAKRIVIGKIKKKRESLIRQITRLEELENKIENGYIVSGVMHDIS